MSEPMRVVYTPFPTPPRRVGLGWRPGEREAEQREQLRLAEQERLQKSKAALRGTHALPETNARMLEGRPPASPAEQAESARRKAAGPVERTVKCRAKDCDHSAVAWGGGTDNPDGSVQCPGPQAAAVTRARPDLDEQAARRMRNGFDPERGLVVALKRNGAEVLGKLADWSEDMTGATVHTHHGVFQVAMSDLRAVPADELQGHRNAAEKAEETERNERFRAEQARLAKSEAIEPETGPGLTRDNAIAKSGGIMDRVLGRLKAYQAPALTGYARVVALADTEIKDGKIVTKKETKSWAYR
jgi:hypothetical protein